jgi:hypothetical protein
VEENIVAAIGRLDEAEAFVLTEHLDLAARHAVLSFLLIHLRLSAHAILWTFFLAWLAAMELEGVALEEIYGRIICLSCQG